MAAAVGAAGWIAGGAGVEMEVVGGFGVDICPSPQRAANADRVIQRFFTSAPAMDARHQGGRMSRCWGTAVSWISSLSVC